MIPRAMLACTRHGRGQISTHASSYWSKTKSGNEGISLSYHLKPDGQRNAADFPPVDNTKFKIQKGKYKKMSNKLYRPRRKRRKEKLSLMDKIEIGGITIAAVVLIGWSSWSIVDSFTPDPVIPSHEVYTDGISNYIAGLTSDSDSADTEDIKDTDVDSSDVKDTSSDNADSDKKDSSEEAKDTNKKDEKDDKTDSEKEKKQEPETTPTAKAQEATEDAVEGQAETTAAPSQAAVAADTMATEAAAVPTSYTAKDALNIRRTPDEKAQTIANYQAGETLNVTEDDSTHAGWLRVNKNGVDGYVSKDFVNIN